MLLNYLKKVVENIAGPTAVKIVDLLYDKKDINEFLIAKKLGLTINQTRNLLYKLSHIGIISSIRKKDKRKGWYIYFWTFDVMKSLEVLEESINKEMSDLKSQLAGKQTRRFYRCKTCNREVNEEFALLNNFVCLECGEVYGLADNASSIEEVSKQIAKLEKDSSLIKLEIAKEKEIIDKRLNRFLKREEKKKKDLRKKNKKLKKRLDKKLKKQEEKKKNSKKSPNKKKKGKKR